MKQNLIKYSQKEIKFNQNLTDQQLRIEKNRKQLQNQTKDIELIRELYQTVVVPNRKGVQIIVKTGDLNTIIDILDSYSQEGIERIRFKKNIKTSYLKKYKENQIYEQAEQYKKYHNFFNQRLNTNIMELERVCLMFEIDQPNFKLPQFCGVKIVNISCQNDQELNGQSFSSFSPNVRQIELDFISFDFLRKLFALVLPSLKYMGFKIKIKNDEELQQLQKILQSNSGNFSQYANITMKVSIKRKLFGFLWQIQKIVDKYFQRDNFQIEEIEEC